MLRRRAYLDLDRFLMEHREEAILLIVDGLNTEIQRMTYKTMLIQKPSMLSRILGVLRRDTVIQ